MKHRNHVLPILIATALATPAAFAQVLGGGVNVGGGAGIQVGPANIGAGAQTRGDVGVRTDAVRETSRRARDAAARTEAEARAAADAGVSTAQSTGAQMAGAAAGSAQAAATLGAQASGQAVGHVASATAGNADAAADATLGAQGAVHADGHAVDAVSGNATAAANSALTAQAGNGETGQQEAVPAAEEKPTRAERRAARDRDRHER